MGNEGQCKERKQLLLERVIGKLQDVVNELREVRNRQSGVLDRIMGRILDDGKEKEQSKEPETHLDSVNASLKELEDVLFDLTRQAERLEELG